MGRCQNLIYLMSFAIVVNFGGPICNFSNRLILTNVTLFANLLLLLFCLHFFVATDELFGGRWLDGSRLVKPAIARY